MGWEIAQRITLPDPASLGADGSQALAIHGNYLICSKWGGTVVAQQQVYIYVRNNGGEYKLIQTLSGSDYGAVDGNSDFGVGVGVYGNDFIVGQDNTGRAVSGRVDIFRRNNYGEIKHVQTLRGETADDSFGITVWLSKNYAIVGANSGGGGTGCVYIYEKNNDGNYNRIQKIDGPTATPASSIGGVASRITDNYALFMDGNELTTGKVFIYIRNNNGEFQENKIIDFGGATGDAGAGGLGISGNNLVIGGEAVETNGACILYIRKNDGSFEELKRFKDDTNTGLGYKVAISGNFAASVTAFDSSGQLVFFKRGNDGEWIRDGDKFTTTLTDLGSFDGLHMDGNYLAVTSPNSGTGQVLIFHRKY